MDRDAKIRLAFLAGAIVIMMAVFGFTKKSGSDIENDATLNTTIAVATDLHYLAPELTDQGSFFQSFIENGDGKVIQYSEELTEAFVSQIIIEKPDVLILSGDITFNGEKQSHVRLAEKLKRIEDAGITVLVMPGNHDLYSSNAASFEGDSYTLVESVSAQEFEEIYGGFGFEEALASDPNSLSYVAEITPELWVLMVDVNTQDSPGTVKSVTYAWLEQQFEEAEKEGARVIAVSHQNVLQHNSLFSYGYIMGRADFVSELYEKNNVICNLTGHIHMQHIAQNEAGLKEIATSSLAVSPNQYGVLELNNGTADYHTVVVDVAAWAKEKEEENLQGFADYSYTFMWDTAYRQAAALLEGNGNANLLSAFYADINTAYFAGRMDAFAWNEDIFRDWKEQGGFIATYLQSIADDGFKNHTEYTFSYK